MSKKYYAVISANAVGIFDNYYKACNQLNYLTGHRYPKSFISYYEASEYAMSHLASIATGKRLPEDFPLNFIVRAETLDSLIVPFLIHKRQIV